MFGKLTNFLRAVRTELKLVEWVKPRQLLSYTWIVIAFTASLTIAIYIMDIALVALRSAILGPSSI